MMLDKRGEPRDISSIHPIFKGWFAHKDVVLSHEHVSPAAKNVDAIIFMAIEYRY